MNRLRGTLVLPDRLVPGEVVFDTRIRQVLPSGPAVAFHDAEPPFILPGFIDAHVHGGGGGDAMDGVEGVRAMAAFHARHGTTTMLPTTMTNPFEKMLDSLRGVREARDATVSTATSTSTSRASTREDTPAGSQSGAQVLADIPGAHLEGPFISPDRLGAQPAFAVLPTEERMDAVLATGVVRLVTIAPEIEGAFEAAERFAAAGVRVSIGHTVATYEQVAEFSARVRDAGGTLGFTHLYNAMPGLGSRAPGVVGAALSDSEAWSELILDLHHVHAASARAAWFAKGEKLLLVTDAIRSAGESEGESELGGLKVYVSGGGARLADGTLAGSVLTLDVALRNAVSIGMPLPRASHALSAAPAAYLGLEDRGRIAIGLRADLVVVDADLAVTGVWVEGAAVDGSVVDGGASAH